MCGIAGVIGARHDERLAERLLGALAHRGPDDRGVAVHHGALLVQTRLAILDLSCAGHQPMVDVPAGGGPANALVFNGEIYNFQSLHAPLVAAGWPPRSASDTEVLLHAYRAWGEGFLDRLRGMWAFCLVDASRGVAVLARDRFGMKPLYLCRPPGGGLLFASELRALLAVGAPWVPRTVDPLAVEGFLAQGAVQGYASLVRGVTLLPPGEILTVSLETGLEVNRRRYWQLPAPGSAPPRDRREAVRELGRLAREAVRLHLVSDVPTGLFLSGGVDSAALLSLASEVQPEAVRTLTVGFDVPEFDESAEAAAVARRFGARHTEVRLTARAFLERLPEALAAMDQPTIDGVNVFAVSRAAREAGLTVALSGLGSDELFGGYSSFRDVPRAARLRRWLPGRPLASLVERARPDRAGTKLAEMMRRPADALGLYLLRRELFLPAERRLLHERPPEADASSGLPTALLDDAARRGRGFDAETQVSRWELELYMRHTLLRDGDAFSMAAPIEYRLPFLDHELAEAAFRLPGRWKRPDPRPKPLLLDLVGEGRIPESAWRAPKRGFSLPWASLFAHGGALAPLLDDAVADADTWRSLGLSPAGVTSTWRRFRAGDRRIVATQMLAFVVLREFAVRHALATG